MEPANLSPGIWETDYLCAARWEAPVDAHTAEAALGSEAVAASATAAARAAFAMDLPRSGECWPWVLAGTGLVFVGVYTLVPSFRARINGVLARVHEFLMTGPKSRLKAARAAAAAGPGTAAEAKIKQQRVKFVTSCILPPQDDITRADIVGLDDAIRVFDEALREPQAYPNLFAHGCCGGLLAPVRGILLHGEPGNGKTMLARMAASEMQAVFYNVSGSSIMSRDPGEAEARLEELFTHAREHAPAIVFFDEADALMCTRDAALHPSGAYGVLTKLLTLMDGVASRPDGVLVVSATNRLQDLDPAIRRRFQKKLLVGPPSAAGREALLRSLLQQGPVALAADADLASVAGRLAGCSAADVKLAAQSAVQRARREAIAELDALPAAQKPRGCEDAKLPLRVSAAHLEAALAEVIDGYEKERAQAEAVTDIGAVLGGIRRLADDAEAAGTPADESECAASGPGPSGRPAAQFYYY